MTRMLIRLSIGLVACGLARNLYAAPKVVQTIGIGDRLDPIRMARVYPDGTVGEWFNYVGRDDGQCYGPGFDGYEGIRADRRDPCSLGKNSPTDGSKHGGFGEFCDIGGGGARCEGIAYRWWFGLSYVQGGRRTSGVMANDALTGAAAGCRVQFGWTNVLDPGEIDPNGNVVGSTVVVINTYAGQFDQSCGTTEPKFLSGVAIDFGPVNGNSTGYYYTDADLAGGLELDLPSGDVGIEVRFFYDTGLNEPALNNQIMLWAPKDADAQGRQAGVIYDDLNGDGKFEPLTECFDYTGLVPCPDPVGGMVVVYSAGGAACQHFSVNRVVGGQPSTFLVSSPSNPDAPFGVVYFLDEDAGLQFADCVNSAGGNSLSELVRCYGGDPRETFVCQGRINASGEGTCSTQVPQAARGRRITFVSVVQTADGWCAETLTQTVQ